jgi:hypothetical protein
MWRLDEMLGKDGRTSFLLGNAPRTDFGEYKLRSTYYRLAALLGWLRALRRELSFLRFAGKHRITIIDDAIDRLEQTLADGYQVELQRLQGLLQIWGLPAIADDKVRLRLAVDLENCKDNALLSECVASPNDLSESKQIALASDSATLICTSGKFAPVPYNVIVETRHRTIRQIAIREAWLYRDWQTAIGDLVLRESTIGDRSFDVIGFGEFESMILNPTPDQSRLLLRIAGLFDDVNLAHENPFDARPETLNKLLIATAALVSGIGKVKVSAPLLAPRTIAAAKRVLGNDAAKRQAISPKKVGSVFFGQD